MRSPPPSPHYWSKGNGHQSSPTDCHEGKIDDVLRAQKWTLRIVITVDGVVFVGMQRRDAYYRNDPSKYGLNSN